MKKITSFILATILAFSLVGCGTTSQTTVAAYVGVISTAVETVLAVTGNGSATLTKDLNTVQTLIAAWKPGTSSQDVVQALNDLAANLDLIPLGTKYDAAIAAAINGADNLISLIQSESVATNVVTQDVVAVKWSMFKTKPTTTTPRKHVWTGKQIKSSKDLQKAFKNAGVVVK